jgi:hypothetical protein
VLVAAGSLGTVGTAATGIKTDLTEVKSDVKEDPVISDSELTLSDKDVQPVGQDYIEEIKNEEGERAAMFFVSCTVDPFKACGSREFMWKYWTKMCVHAQ